MYDLFDQNLRRIFGIRPGPGERAGSCEDGAVGRLDGKRVLVTGAARGTGEAVARLFAAEGARVLLTDVLDQRGAAAATAIGSPARYRRLDVTRESDWAGAVAEVAESWGGLDVLVNNAAVLHLATIDLTTAEAFERVLRVNVLGAFLGTRACLPLLRAAGGASIVNIGSIDSVAGVSLTAAYTSSKFALRGLTKVTALENAQWKVRANIVCPAAGNPEMHPPVVGAPELAGAPAPAPDPERGPGAVAPAALFLASDESRLCNGTELVLDAAQTAGDALRLPPSWYGIGEAGG